MCLLNKAVLNWLNSNDNGQYFWTSGQFLTRVNILRYNGSYRFCIDYRKLNNNTIKDAYPLSRIDESLDQTSGSSLFSALDFCSGYWQVEMDQEDKPKTAFAIRRGLFQFNNMPFGLCRGQATFERLMESIFAGLHWDICFV